MSKIKKPEWDKPTSNATASGYNLLDPKLIPCSYMDVGMKAYANHKSDTVIINITKVENKDDAEGTIINIIPDPKTKGKTRTDLSLGDSVYINRKEIHILLQG